MQGEIADASIGLIVELTVAAIQEDRPLFPNPIDEPIFYRRYIKRWVREELEQNTAIARKQAADIAALNGR